VSAVPMSIADQWNETRTALKSVPAVVGSLRPPAIDQDLERWAEVVGHSLPESLKELYAVHDGGAVIGGNGFSFVGG
jgi:cell wall assembly regulator SMI1